MERVALVPPTLVLTPRPGVRVISSERLVRAVLAPP